MSSKFKIKVKYERPNESMAKKLLGIYSGLKIKILDIENVRDGFILSIGDLKEGEKIFEENNLRAVANAEFFPILSKEIKCQRTLFVKVNRFIQSHSPNEIINELRICNRDLKIIEVKKMENSSKIKITVDHSNTADIIMNQGIGMFNLHTPGSSISKQEFIDVKKCLNCFKYNDHLIGSCTEPRILKCTICLGPHRYENCQVSPTEAVCFHCQENHHTFAHACKVRRQLEQYLKKQPSESKLYSNVLRNNVVFERRPSAMHSDPPAQRSPLLPLPTPTLPSWTMNSPPSQFPPDMRVPPPPPPPFPLNPATANLMISVMSKTTAAVQLALHSASSKPSSFLKTYEELCKSNNLPILNLENFKPFDSPVNIQLHEADGNAHATAEDLDNTSFLSADGDSLVNNKTQNNQIPSNNSSSPISTSVNKENPQLNTSPISPIKKMNTCMSGAKNIPTYTMPSCSKSPSGTVMPKALSSSATMMPAKNTADKMTSRRAHPIVSIPPRTTSSDAILPRTKPSDATPPRTISSDVTPPRTISSDGTPPRTISSDATPPRTISSDATPPRTSPTDATPIRAIPLVATSRPPSTTLPLNHPITPLMPKPLNAIPPPLSSPLSLNVPLTSTIPIAPLVIGGNSEPDISHQAEITDELRLFTTKRTRIGDRPQLIKWHKEGSLAIKRNGEIIRNENEIEFVLYNRFESLRESKEIIDKKELSRILKNCK